MNWPFIQNTQFLNIQLKSLFVLFTILLTGCEDERLVRQSLADDCANHYRAESYKVASRNCLKAAEFGIPYSQWLLANIYYYDLDDSGRDKGTAIPWFEKAAEAGITDAQTFVGESYLFADGVEEDFNKAYRYLKMAASVSDPQAEFNIGMMFYEGKGKNKDISAAVSWLKRAAAQNHPMSINNLAWLHATSANKSYRNAEKALFWATKLPEETQDSSTFLDTKAAAFALAGEFEKAIVAQNKAIEALPEDIDEDMLLDFQKRLEFYQDNKSWTE